MLGVQSIFLPTPVGGASIECVNSLDCILFHVGAIWPVSVHVAVPLPPSLSHILCRDDVWLSTVYSVSLACSLATFTNEVIYDIICLNALRKNKECHPRSAVFTRLCKYLWVKCRGSEKKTHCRSSFETNIRGHDYTLRVTRGVWPGTTICVPS